MSATAIILLCTLACPVSMALMMLFMRKSHRSSDTRRARVEEKVRDGDAG
jgi:hypothetical protein